MKGYDELEQYLRQDEPDKLNRGIAWATAIENRYMHIRYKGLAADRPSDQATDQVKAVIYALKNGPGSRDEIMTSIGLRHIPTFRKNYLHPALEAGYIERTIPNNPTDSRQRYRLTAKGLRLCGSNPRKSI